MNLDERKCVEDKVIDLLDTLTLGEKAVLYKTLYAEGLKIADCDELIRKAPAPINLSAALDQQKSVASQLHLPRGWPMQP
jgi:hypothetical protein